MSFIFIVSSTLKRLFIENSCRESDTKFKIDTPNLEAFVYEGQYIQNCSVGNLKSLNSALLDFRFFDYYPSSSDEDYGDFVDYSDEDYGDFVSLSDGDKRSISVSTINRVVKLIRACSTTIRLGFAGTSIEALQGATINLPIFKNLNCLALGSMGSDGFQIVAQLLRKAPNLETLTFEEGFNKKIKGGYAIFESSLPKMPICLKLCFKKLVLWEFKGKEDEIKLIEYFLKNGKALQEVLIYYDPIVDASILNRLLQLPRSSQMCQILTRRGGDWQVRYSAYARKTWF